MSPNSDLLPAGVWIDTGLHTQIPDTAVRLAARSEQGVRDLIAVVGDVKPYVDSPAGLTNPETQEEKGLLMTDLDGVIQYC